MNMDENLLRKRAALVLLFACSALAFSQTRHRPLPTPRGTPDDYTGRRKAPKEMGFFLGGKKRALGSRGQFNLELQKFPAFPPINPR